MTDMTVILALAVTVEALVEYGKTLIASVTQGGWKTALLQAAALSVSVVLCVLAGADLFGVLGIPLGGGITGCVFTGILTARGSNYMADLVKRLTQKSQTS